MDVVTEGWDVAYSWFPVRPLSGEGEDTTYKAPLV